MTAATEPKRRGRPKLADGAGKSERLELRLESERKAKLARLATAAGVSQAECIGRLIDWAPEPLRASPREA